MLLRQNHLSPDVNKKLLGMGITGDGTEDVH